VLKKIPADFAEYAEKPQTLPVFAVLKNVPQISQNSQN